MEGRVTPFNYTINLTFTINLGNHQTVSTVGGQVGGQVGKVPSYLDTYVSRYVTNNLPTSSHSRYLPPITFISMTQQNTSTFGGGEKWRQCHARAHAHAHVRWGGGDLDLKEGP